MKQQAKQRQTVQQPNTHMSLAIRAHVKADPFSSPLRGEGDFGAKKSRKDAERKRNPSQGE